MGQIYVKPAVAGSIVRHPEKLSYILPQEGEYVENSTQWQRYLRHGDVVLAEPAQVQSEKPTKQSKTFNKEGDTQ